METHELRTSDQEVTIRELVVKIKSVIRYFRSRWKIIFLISLLGAVGGYLYAYFEKTQYTATLTFTLEDDKGASPGLGGALGLASSLGFDLGTNGGNAFAGNNIIELIKSRRIVERTLLSKFTIGNKTQTLADHFLDVNYRGKRTVPPGIFSDSLGVNSILRDSLLAQMHKQIVEANLSVGQRDKKVSIITIETKSADEMFSKLFTENILKEVSDFYVDTKSKKAAMNVYILQKQADSVRTELNAAISGVASANDNIFSLNPAMNVQRIPSTRKQVDVQANTAILTELIKNLELAKVNLRKETPLVQIIDTPKLPLLKTRPGRIKAALMFFCVTAMFVMAFLLGRFWLGYYEARL